MLYNTDLHYALAEGNLKNSPNSKGGVYLVMFRVLKKNDNVLVYNYVYYNKLFINSLLYYLTNKTDFAYSYLFKEWGDFLCFIDKNLFGENFKGDNIFFNEYFKDHYKSDTKNVSNNEFLAFYDQVKKLSFAIDQNELPHLIKLGVIKKYKDFFIKISSSFENDLKDIHSDYYNIDLYLLRDCLFVVKDLTSILHTLRSLGFQVTKGPENLRQRLNSMSSFLSCIDDDYRQNLYKYQINDNNISIDYKLPRSKFSFKNIHMNLGNVKYYSTVSTEKKR